MNSGVILIGVSAGGLRALEKLFQFITKPLNVPILIVQHMASDSENYLSQHLDEISIGPVVQAQDKVTAKPGVTYIAPGGYHMLVDTNLLIELSIDDRVCYSRPSIDVLFESAAEISREKTLAIILTGANSDGTAGVKAVKSYGGLVIAQDPETAESEIMPKSAIESGCVDFIFSLKEISQYINQHYACS